jgi:hypothetical protein
MGLGDSEQFDLARVAAGRGTGGGDLGAHGVGAGLEFGVGEWH